MLWVLHEQTMDPGAMIEKLAHNVAVAAWMCVAQTA